MTIRLDVNDFRKYHLEDVYGVDEELTFYYDETNNIRKLYLTDHGLNISECKNFVLAGIMHTNDSNLDNVDELKRELNLQNTVNEIKFKHIARGDYESVLSSRKLSMVLSWLLENGIYIHYTNLNILHWSILDIVESLLVNEEFKSYLPYHMELKNELYHIVKSNVPAFLAVLKRFNYPNIQRKETDKFLKEINLFLDEFCPRPRCNVTQKLKTLLRRACSLKELVFLVDNSDNQLIESFHDFYMHPVYMFKNAVHVFDQESKIEEIMNNYEIVDGARKLNYSFSNSIQDIGIQLSDVICGFLGKHFNYIDEHSLPNLLKKKQSFNNIQLKNFRLLKSLIDKSDDFSNALLHYVGPMDSAWKNDSFLHGLNPVPHLMR